jgi:hypothetical protein
MTHSPVVFEPAHDQHAHVQKQKKICFDVTQIDTQRDTHCYKQISRQFYCNRWFTLLKENFIRFFLVLFTTSRVDKIILGNLSLLNIMACSLKQYFITSKSIIL